MLEQFILLQTSSSAGSGMSTIIMIVAMIAIFYFMMIRPQKKQQKKIQQFRDGLKKGDRVVTAGGFYGKIVSTSDAAYFIVEIADGVKVRVAKSSVYEDSTQAESVGESAVVNK